MKLIDKEILLLKIDSKIEEAQKVFNVAPSSVIGGMIEGYTRTKKIISSLEVKEVDLQSEIDRVWDNTSDNFSEDGWKEFENIAKHFFELGLRSTITEEYCKLIWNIGDEIPNMPEEEFFKELLKRFKAQKGE